MRRQMRQAADRLGLLPHVRRFRRRLGPKNVRRAMRDDEHLRLLLVFALTSESNCVDVGSHEGSVLTELLRVAPDGRHIAYEPLPHLADALRHRFPTVDVRCAAASNRAGQSPFVHVIDRPDHSGLLARTVPGNPRRETINVRLEALDEALPSGYAPSLIKIDVEGAEQQVIEGAMRTITASRPIVVFEHGRGGADHYGTEPADIHRLLCHEAGMRLFDLDGNGPYTLAALQKTFERGDRWNFVARA